MGYVEPVPSPKGDYWRVRYQAPDGAYLTVQGDDHKPARFSTRKEAEEALADVESDLRKDRWKDPRAGAITFEDWAAEWYAALDVAESTMVNYRRHLEDHLLQSFGKHPLDRIDAALIRKWERSEKADGYKPASIRTWRGTLHNILGDAVPDHISVNPAARKRGKGRRSGAGRKSAGSRGPEMPVATPLAMLLIAERLSVLTGRDDEFVMVQTGFWHALRLGETVGLERPFTRPRTLRVEWQLYEIEAGDNEELRAAAPGGMLRCPPKDDSYGTLDTPPFLRPVLSAHIAGAELEECPCHGAVYMFRGYGAPRLRGNMPMSLIAASAGVSQTVVQAALGGKGRISEAARRHVLEVARTLGYDRGPAAADPARHWRRSSFEELFHAAVTGLLAPSRPGRGREALPARGVPLAGEWPGTRVRGPYAERRAEWCWLPVAEGLEGLTPHGWRHSWKTWAEESRIPEVMSESVLRHEIPGVSGVYRHVTPGMRAELAAAETEAWEGALDARLEMSESSTVAVVDGLLRARLEARKPRSLPRNSPETDRAVLPFERSAASDLRKHRSG
jgi:Phage integrase, N-terminal SAM-like domain/Bacterial regulatory proteins, lacI family